MVRKNELDCIKNVRSAFERKGNFLITRYNCNLNNIQHAFNTLREPRDANSFPDFVFDGGIIEHFIVTGYKETKDGSKFKIEENQKNKETDNFFLEEDRVFQNSPIIPGTIQISKQENIYDNSSYKDFVYSFKKNFQKHLCSLAKSEYCNQTKIFLIQQEDAQLVIYKDNKFKDFYSLSEDKNLLNYLKEKQEFIDYVVFYAGTSVEIIFLANIDVLLNKAKDNLDIRSGRKRDLTVKIYRDY